MGLCLSLLLHSKNGLGRVRRHLPPGERGTRSVSQGSQHCVLLPEFQATLEIAKCGSESPPRKTQSKFYTASQKTQGSDSEPPSPANEEGMKMPMSACSGLYLD